MAKPRSLWIDVRKGLNGLVIQQYAQSHFEEPHSCASMGHIQMMTFLGSKSKTRTLKTLFSVDSTDASGFMSLWSTSTVEGSILLADCIVQDVESFPKISYPGQLPPDIVVQHPLRWAHKESRPRDIANIIYTQLVSPFSTVVCIFEDDIGGSTEVARTLAGWLDVTVRPSDLPPEAYPRIFVIQELEDNFDEGEATRRLMNQLQNEIPHRQAATDFKRIFHSGLEILGLPRATRNLKYGEGSHFLWGAFRNRILQASATIQTRRRELHYAFSQRHFETLFRSALSQFADDHLNPFNFIAASRSQNPVPLGLPSGIAEFLTSVSSMQTSSKPLYKQSLEKFGVSIIGSALALDSYPSDMHAFPPSKVFSTLYNNALIQVNISPHIMEQVEERFRAGIEECITESKSMARVHQAVLRRFEYFWLSLYSPTRCLSCLVRGHTNTLSCRHALCDSCVIMHSQAPKEPWKFEILECPLCGILNAEQIRLRPRTAGVRGLCIGGVCDHVVIADFLLDLERKLRLTDCALQELFDIMVGSGSGAYYIVGIFCKLRTIEECCETFVDCGITGLRQGWIRRVSQERLSYTWIKALNINANSTLLTDFLGTQALLSFAQGAKKVALLSHNEVFATYVVDSATSRHNVETPSWEAYSKVASHSIGSEEFFQELQFLGCPERSIDILVSLGLKTQYDRTSRRHSSKTLQEVPNTAYERDIIGLERPPTVSAAAELLASAFYIELDGLPVLARTNSTYASLKCHVHILCRLSSIACKDLLTQLAVNKARFYFKDKVPSAPTKSIPCAKLESLGQSFPRCVEIEVLSVEDTLDLKVDITVDGDWQLLSISNCPYQVKDLIQDQGLNCPFGRSDHVTWRRKPCQCFADAGEI